MTLESISLEEQSAVLSLVLEISTSARRFTTDLAQHANLAPEDFHNFLQRWVILKVADEKSSLREQSCRGETPHLKDDLVKSPYLSEQEEYGARAESQQPQPSYYNYFLSWFVSSSSSCHFVAGEDNVSCSTRNALNSRDGNGGNLDDARSVDSRNVLHNKVGFSNMLGHKTQSRREDGMPRDSVDNETRRSTQMGRARVQSESRSSSENHDRSGGLWGSFGRAMKQLTDPTVQSAWV